ncbi:MAG: hypothetical protein KQH63_13435 [Desulfobulbaceae bacterium]|nr:hypothetical protein [Desulfobulbaceae bacterium]
MNIIVGSSPSVKKDPDKVQLYQGLNKEKIKERRKRKQDRRKSHREGVIVSLSISNDRRVRSRRKTG